MSHSKLRGSVNYIWNIQDSLGVGATGSVYRCRHKNTGILYAVKTFNQASFLRSAESQKREFEVLPRLNHENVVKVLAIEEEKTSRSKVIVMELCTGGSVYQMIEEPRNAFGLEEDEVFLIILHIARGMQHLKEHNIVHRDIKPGNILRYVAEDGRSIYKITDFGGARQLQPDEEHFASIQGTEEYLHPDMYGRAMLQNATGHRFGADVDLWSIGCTIFHIATGHLPFRPFGGRKNKETMYNMTKNKESGIISGEQHSEKGEIEWSRELPKNCKLSQGSKDVLTPLIRGLLETNPTRLWSFEQFFRAVDDITEKKRIHIFHVPTATLIHIFIDKRESMAGLQDLIARQTDMHASNQLLIFYNNPLDKVVTQVQLVETYPETTRINPIFLLPVSYVHFSKLVLYELPPFSKLSPEVKLEEDVQTVKAYHGNLYFIQHCAETSIYRQQYVHKAVDMFHFVVMKELEYVRNCLIQYSSLCDETKKRLDSFLKAQQRELSLLKLIVNHSNGDRAKLASLSEHKFKNEEVYAELAEKMAQIRFDVEAQYQSFVIRRELEQKWENGFGCRTDDRCSSKLDVLLTQVAEIKDYFRQDRKCTKLSSNDEQIHKYNKQQLHEIAIRAMSVVSDHCHPNLHRLYKRFAEWFIQINRIRLKLLKLQTTVSKEGEKQGILADQLDKHMLRYEEKVHALRSSLRDDMGLPVEAESGYKTNSHPATLAAQSGVFEHSLSLVSRQADSYHQLNESLSSLQDTTLSVHQELEHNSDLLKEINDLSL